MAVQKGSEVLLQLSNGASPPVYTTIGGDQGCEFEYEDGSGEYTHKTATGLWQLFLDGGTIRRLRVNLTFVDIDDSGLQTIFAALMGSGNRHISAKLLMPGFGDIVSTWHIPSFGYSGELDAAAAGSISLNSSGAPTFTAT